MAHLLDYVRWRGDLAFDIEPFNSLDAALFAALSYLPFDKSVTGHTLGEASERLYYKRIKPYKLGPAENLELQLMPISARYKNIEFVDWSKKIQKRPAIQFTAATFRIAPKKILVSFRGTDGSMIGITEDVYMSYQPEITGQTVAANYLQEIANRFPNSEIITVGHSKGGNFATYAVASLPPQDQDRVIKAYSFDGPGFMKETYDTPNFQSAISKMITYVPEGSIFGMMLDHPERTLVVKSDVNMMKQHDPRRWNVARDGFVLAPGLTNTSRIIRNSFISWNTEIPRQQRQAFWLALFSAIENQNITEFSQLKANKLRAAIQFSYTYLNLPPDIRLIANQIISDIAATARTHVNIPLINKADTLKPLGNDSSKGPIVLDSYNGA
ncbi:hypothetical protein J2Z60_001937 [Lactobacillus colini]|uniref:DUF2974 domain-containing protein n=1 Tax=Lactobacillus colini TaxID=1819254 RepID=A0ABS4MGC7_9LACO|nr:Mbeg1-like protein [Lactobacillus colini]MBP2058748.1 hypothetical protein [Lactobacillus colini]